MRYYKKTTLITFGITALVIFASLVAPFAANAVAIPSETVATDADAIFRVIDSIFSIGFGILLVLAGLFILYAAFLYLQGGASDENVSKAKNYIIYAIVAVIVAFLSKAIINLVEKNILVR